MRPRRDSRNEQRRPVDVSATVSIAGRKVAARTRDLSRSGICLISDTEIPRDTELRVELVLSLGADAMSEPLIVLARTIWCTAIAGKFQVGAMFVQLDNERGRFLDLFMRFLDGEVNPVGHEPASDVPSRKDRPEDKDDPFRP
ncbi:MAG: PilZ domain-containing protein [Pseudomonadota bacterium]